MKKDQVRVGGTYEARVSEELTVVRLESTSVYGGWNARNLGTGAQVRVKTAGRLRNEVRGAQRVCLAGEVPVGNRVYFLGCNEYRVLTTPEQYDAAREPGCAPKGLFCCRPGKGTERMKIVDCGKS